MSDLKPGDIVDIAIKGVRVAPLAPVRDDDRDNPVIIADERGHLYALPPQAAVTRVAPAEWPPREGDLWRDRHGELWFVFRNPIDNGPDLRGRTAQGLRWTDDATGLLRDCGPLTLVRREQTDGGEAG